MKTKSTFLTIIVWFAFTISNAIYSQNFVQVNGQPNSITNLDDYWTGAAWVDIDNDDDLDLFLTNRLPGTTQRKNKLYTNDAGNFTEVTSGTLVDDFGFWFGNTWGDYNNDDLIDVYVAGYPGRLYTNLGNGNFEKVITGAIADPEMAGISAAFGDFNNDGNLDLIQVRPNWLAGPPSTGNPGSPWIMINDGPPNYTFTRLLDTDVNDPTDGTYLHPTLSDFDGDGDLDIFIGMGSGMPMQDLMYRNLLAQTGNLDFQRITGIPLSDDLVEGNQWSFIDIDNDQDLDAYLTNWATMDGSGNTIPAANSLYRNNSGSYLEDTSDIIATDPSLTSTVSWGDYDNDGDLDAITACDAGHELDYYQNDGAGNFIKINAGELGTTDKNQSGASNGDYDNDGDLDIFIPGPGVDNSFFRNDLANGNNWVKFKLKGTESNQSGIGAKVWITSQGITQMREVSAASTFFGMNSLIQHFGLNTASSLDQVLVQWPTGSLESFDGLGINSTHVLEEGQGVLSVESTATKNEILVYPNPVTADLLIAMRQSTFEEAVNISIYDLKGAQVYSAPVEELDASRIVMIPQSELSSLKEGIYILTLTTNGKVLFNHKLVISK
ncbi:MAG: VCBS repeat-containing protein [Flavobacteriaceae bacterium]|nr:VCBS repeat-containing protein [Flavobacteriaceae bacterium]